MSQWKKGTKLNNDQYVIDSLLLRSGYGLSYRATDKQTNQFVTIKATKIFWQNQNNASKLEEKFVKQAKKIATKCQSPYLVKLNPQVYFDKKQVFMVMEYPQGIDLASYVDSNGKLPEQDALNIITKISSAVNIFHQQKSLHQDLKPHNIIIDADTFEPKLIDYGISIKLFVAAQTKKTSNTNDCFIAPEVHLFDSKLTIGSDIYSLAATFYALVTGELPLATNIRSFQNLPAPQQLVPELSDRISEGIMKGMELDPQQRPQHLKDWLDLFKPASAKAKKSVDLEADKTTQPVFDPLNAIVADEIPETIVQKASKNVAPATITKREKSYPNIEKFTFETVKVESQKRLFGFISEDKNIFISGEGQLFNEYLEDDISLEMVFIPAGSFMMGGNKEQKDENPLHSVNLKSFYISRYPITQQQWRVVSYFPKVTRYLKHKPSFFKGENLPVERVSWLDCQEFCKRLSKYTGRNYRLPTESEWEYACRGKTKTDFFCGENLTLDTANYDEQIDRENNKNNAQRKLKRTTPVDKYYPNPFGLYDCHGNIWEWCADHYVNGYHQKPTDGSAYYSEQTKPERVIRGGAWSTPVTDCRSGKRNGYIADSTYNFLGCRVVCVLD